MPPPVDPELRDIFLEEYEAVLESLQSAIPDWMNDLENAEALTQIRRAFHTLKGSGRMVGAERIGEYSWNIENLLNRLINRTLVRTPPMVDFIVEAAGAVPELIEQLEVGDRIEVEKHPPAQLFTAYVRQMIERRALGVPEIRH